MGEQLNFSFSKNQSYVLSDFIVSEANSSAYNVITKKFEDLPANIICISGVKGSGKTHLAHIWNEITGAKFINIKKFFRKGKDIKRSYTELAEYLKPETNYILENLQNISNEYILLYIVNLINEKKCRLVLTSEKRLSELKFSIPDLQSRINTIFDVTIHTPDVNLVKMLMTKQFTDRQIAIDSTVIDFVSKRIRRDFDNIKYIIDLLDKASLQEKRKITIPLAKKALGI